jgi:uncharacterized protein with NRDE domain
MCLIGVAWKSHPRYALVVAANRDEFHARPSAPAASWDEAPDVFGGRDLSAGGSWLALSTRSRLACVTNVRRMVAPDPQAPSRGQLVSGFVRGAAPAAHYSAALQESAPRYAGFNLLIWDGNELRYLNNHPGFISRAVAPGVHVVSNADLDTPWPKTRRLQAALSAWTASGVDDPEPLFSALADRTPAADGELPDTGVGLELERMLAPPFIVSPRYGTRCSTVVLVAHDGRADFIERRFAAAGGQTDETRQTLQMAKESR